MTTQHREKIGRSCSVCRGGLEKKRCVDKKKQGKQC